MRLAYIILLFVCTLSLSAQVASTVLEVKKDSLAPVADPKYREDQFYTSIAYNILGSKPAGFKQNSVSTSLTAGVLRDIPVNARRNHSIAIGLGYSYNNFKHNLLVTELAGARNYEVVPESAFDKNKLVLHYLEMPLELRWRNSDSISHKFWRIYAGFKISCLFADKSEFDAADGSTVKVKNNPDLNKLLYGTYISVGYNTFNLYAYYSLNPIYKNAVLSNGQDIKLNALNVGLIFYIL
jgi:hypothetical protein